MFIITIVSCVVALIVLVRMMNEATQEQINNDRLRYVSLPANERQIAQKFDARLMPRRTTRAYMHD